jgi:hypothetical protein
MKIKILDKEVLVMQFSTFEDLTTGFKVDEELRGEPVNLYALDALLIGIGLWLLDKAVDKAMDKSIDWIVERPKQDAELQASDAARSHEELIQELRSLKETISQARMEAHELGNLNDFSPKMSQMARLPARVIISLDTGPETDLSDAFGVISRFIPLEITSRGTAKISEPPSSGD